MISITPYGAAGEVTGSAYLVETTASTILVDFGMFQGDKDDDAKNVIPGPIHRIDIDAVVLTHGHLDHSGRLPLLVREGDRGPIFATEATRDITEIILKDSAHIQEMDFARHKRHAERRKQKISRMDQPLYDDEDVIITMALFENVNYGTPHRVTDNITATFHEAGHMLGSASITLEVVDGDQTKRLVFSGDIGPVNLPFLRDPNPPIAADVVVMESTYGDRDHRSLEETQEEFAEFIEQAVSTRGKVFIPSFAIGRSQNILYYLAELIRTGRLPKVPIFLDSPMAIRASRMYAKHHKLFDQEATDLIEDGQLGRDLSTVKFCSDSRDSIAINSMEGPFIVIAGSGMCNAGRILHHLRHNLDDPNTHIVIVGYQARGSLGRYLVNRSPTVSVMGQRMKVRAQIHTLGGFSAHAGRRQLMEWVEQMSQAKPKIILTHGEDDPRVDLAIAIEEKYHINSVLPVYSEHIVI